MAIGLVSTQYLDSRQLFQYIHHSFPPKAMSQPSSAFTLTLSKQIYLFSYIFCVIG